MANHFLMRLNLLILLVIGSNCKTSEIKDISKIDQEGAKPISLALVHQGLIESIFDSAIEEDQEKLVKYMTENKWEIAKDFYEHKLEYEEILKGFNRQGVITKDQANKIKGQFDRLAALGVPNEDNGFLARVARGTKITDSIFDKKMQEVAVDIHKVIGNDFRDKGLRGFLNTVFEPILPKDGGDKALFDMMFDYFDQTISIPGEDVVKQSHQLDIVKKSSLSILQDHKGKGRSFWEAMLIKDSNNLWKLNVDEITGKGLVRLMEQSGPVMTKIIQSFVEDMTPEMQASVRSVQGSLPPIDEELTKKRFAEINIDLNKQGVYSWPSNEEVLEHAGIKNKEKLKNFGTKQDPRMYRNLGTASLSDSKILYLKRGGKIEEVVVKFIKDDAIAKYEKEVEFFKKSGLSKELKRYVDLYVNAVPGEFDLNDEAENLKRISEGGYFSQKGVSIDGYNKKIDFSVVNQPNGIDFNKGTKKAIIMTKASGRPISSWVSEREDALNKSRSKIEDFYFNNSEKYKGLRNEKYVILKKLQNVRQPEARKQLEVNLEKNVASLTEEAKRIELANKDSSRLIADLKVNMDALEELDKVVQGINRQWILSGYNYGVIHPDPHQGNVFLDFPKGGNPKVEFIDVGGTVKIPDGIRFNFVNLLTGLEFKDYIKTMNSLRGLCRNQCRWAPGNLDTTNGEIEKIVGTNDSPEKKLRNVLEILDNTPIAFDPGFEEFVKGQAIMFKNTSSVHKKTIEARNSHHSFAEKKITSPIDSTGKVFKVDLEKRFISTYTIDAVNVFASKYLKVHRLNLPAVVTAAGIGVFFGDELGAFSLATGRSNDDSHSCVIDRGDFSICITYEGPSESSYEKLQQDCSNNKSGIWLKDEYACGLNRGVYYGCNIGISSVSYSTNQQPGSVEYKYICTKLSEINSSASNR